MKWEFQWMENASISKSERLIKCSLFYLKDPKAEPQFTELQQAFIIAAIFNI